MDTTAVRCHPRRVTDPTPAALVWSRGRRALTAGLLVTASSGAFEALAVATVLPATVGEIGGLELYGWAFSGFMLANLIGIRFASMKPLKAQP